MSKRLPYYQSEPAEYLAGDIMFCSYSAQGVFSIIRALYWQKDCKLTLDQAKRRCPNSDKYIEELINEKVIKIKDDNISISFLDIQFEKATGKSIANSENGKKGAAKRWANKGVDSVPISESIAPLLKNDGESMAFKRNNIKRNKIKEEREADFKKSLHIFLDKYDKNLLNDFYLYWTESNPKGTKMKFEMQKTFDIGRRLAKWKSNNFNNDNYGRKKREQQQLGSITEAIRKSNPNI